MTQERWDAVDEFIAELLAPSDPVLSAALERSDQTGLPEIQVSAPQARLLEILARAVNARAILEIGTLGGYSTIWLARGLAEGGRLITLEYDPAHAEVAEQTIIDAGLEGIVELKVGDAMELLGSLGGVGPFDLTFIDADKVHNPDYFEWAIEHSRAGSLIVADNVVRDGALGDADSDDPSAQAQRRMHEALAADPRVIATTIQTVGVKGYDGFTIGLVTK